MLPSKPERAVAAMFWASIHFQLGDGATIAFWMDAWLPDGAICATAPSLFRAVGSHRRAHSVRDALHNRQWTRDITGALTASVLIEYVHLWDKVDGIVLTPGTPDRLIWRWSADGVYSSSSAYRAFFAGSTSLLGARQVWRASVPPPPK